MSKRICVTVIMGLFVSSFITSSSALVTETDVKIGAYYYIWWGITFNPHWDHGVNYTSFFGEYNSSDPLTADRHILLAKEHGIDFFVISWLGDGTWVDWINETQDHTWDYDEIDRNLNNSFLKASHLQNFNFCLMYETEIILENAKEHDKNFTDIFIDDMIYAAENYFVNPSYLRINGKPALFIYNLEFTYNTLGNTTFAQLFDDLRQRISVYLVGDVGRTPSPYEVASNLLDSMDAVTSYFFAHANISEGWQNITAYAEEYYPKWRSNMTSRGIKFIPNAYPGFDDTKHCEWKQANNISCTPKVLPLNDTMFEKMLNIAINNTDKDLKTIMITSWNEWLESTSIEPSMEFGELFLHTVYLIPEFPSFFILPLFMIATLLMVTIYRRKHTMLKK